jgi:RND family efflux transporter MFP subunit
MNRWKFGFFLGIFVFLGVGWAVIRKHRAAEAQESSGRFSFEAGQSIPVRVIKPMAGGPERVTIQPASVQSFEVVDIFAQVSGLLKKQKVDIGSEVKDGELLGEIFAPELIKEEAHAVAALEQTKAQVDQAVKHVDAIAADVEATKKLVEQRKEEKKSYEAYWKYRKAELKRFKELVKLEVLDMRVYDEETDRFEAAQSRKDAAIIAVETAEFDVKSKRAKLEQVKADVAAAKANVLVAEATLGKAKTFVSFTKLDSPFAGVITKRYYNNGAFIRAAERSGQSPLWTVKRTDLMRVIVQIPDTDVPFMAVGNAAVLKISTLGSQGYFTGKVSRLANSEDYKTRTMRAEVDLENKDNLLRDGMYGQMTIHLKSTSKSAFTLPSSCIKSDAEGRQRFVFVVKDMKAHKVFVRVGLDNAEQAEILSGLGAEDRVICEPSTAISDGARVEIINSPK